MTNTPDKVGFTKQLPLFLALLALIFGGVFLLNRANEQARDTIRKHHLFDLETALLFAEGVNENLPPYDQPSWCGSLHEDGPERQQIEAALREQNTKYANPDKPFATDPSGQPGYFYKKISPEIFELYAMLENESEGSFNISNCDDKTTITYNYGLNSALRQDISRLRE